MADITHLIAQLAERQYPRQGSTPPMQANSSNSPNSQLTPESRITVYVPDEEANSSNSPNSQPQHFAAPQRPRLSLEALYGPAGEVIRRLAPITEADPAAMYVQLLVGLGSLIGPGAWFMADGARHQANLFAVICGRTAKARKGTSWSRVRNVLLDLDEPWLTAQVKSGLVSGEGLIESFKNDADKRLLLFEGEFGQVLQCMKREGNTVSVILRQAWDGTRIAVLRRKDPIEVEDAHISLIGHITLPELHRLLASVEISNGLANRCLWVFADRERLLPEGGGLPDLYDPVVDLNTAVISARYRGQLERDPAARQLWAEIYEELSEEPPGQLGEILSRGEAQVMRLALLFALLDRCSTIGCAHLEAALSLWHYCCRSAAFIFADIAANPKSVRIHEALQGGPLTLSQVHALFGGHARKAEINLALRELDAQIVVENIEGSKGKIVRLR